MTRYACRRQLPRVAAACAIALLLPGCVATSWIPWIGDGGDTPQPVAAEDAPDEIAQLERKSVEQPVEPYWPFRIAEIRADTGEPAAAEAALRVALLRDPDHAPSLSLLSRIWYEAGRHDEAIDLLEQARTRRKLPDVLGVELALHYDAGGDPDAAENIVRQLEGGLGDWSASGSALTYVRLRGERFADAEGVAEKALEANPSAINHNNYGIARLYGGHPEEAREHFEEAHREDPTLPGPLYNLAIVDHFYRFDTESARGWFRRYHELSDDDPDGLQEALAVELAGSKNATREDNQ